MFLFRIGFLFKAVFWIVLVSYVVTGGDYEKASHAEGFAAPEIKAAGHVVQTVGLLRTFCDDHEKICKDVRKSAGDPRKWGKTVSEKFSNALNWSDSQLKRMARKD